jgi:hypothetical protein
MSPKNSITTFVFFVLTFFSQAPAAKDKPVIVDKPISANSFNENANREFDQQNKLYRKQKALYEEWLKDSSLRARWFLTPKDNPNFASIKNLPTYEIPAKNVRLIRDVISLIEGETFSKEDISKKIGLRFAKDPEVNGTISSEFVQTWPAEFVDPANSPSCAALAPDGSQNAQANRFNLINRPHFGLAKLQGGEKQYLSIPIDSFDWLVDKRQEFEFYKTIFPADDVTWPTPRKFEFWHVAPMLKWRYSAHLDKEFNDRNLWGQSFFPEARFNLDPSFQRQRVHLPSTYEKSWKEDPKWTGPLEFSLVSTLKDVNSAVAARALIDSRSRVFLGRNKTYKLYFDSFRRASSKGDISYCARLLVEADGPIVSSYNTPFNPRTVDEIYKALYDFTFNKLDPKLQLALERAPDQYGPTVFELKSMAATTSARSHNLLSSLDSSIYECKQQAKNYVLSREDCLRFGEITFAEIVPEHVSGLKCLKSKQVEKYLRREVAISWAKLKSNPKTIDLTWTEIRREPDNTFRGINNEGRRGFVFFQTVRVKPLFEVTIPWARFLIEGRGSEDCIQSIRLISRL